MKPRRKRRLWNFLLATTLLACVPLGVSRWLEFRRRSAPKTPYEFPLPELAAVDKVVQARFAVVPTDDFGLGRVGARHQHFRPVTASENSAIAVLKRARYDVIFFVAGRSAILDYMGAYGRPYPVQGPVYITQQAPLNVVPVQKWLAQFGPGDFPVFKTQQPLPDGLPPENALYASLKRGAQGAFQQFDSKQGASFKVANWDVLATPVRASQQACADCHNLHTFHRDYRLFVGDTLGVAMYAYRKRLEVQPKARNGSQKP